MGFEQLTALKAQLNQGATSKTVASRSRSSPVGATGDIKQPPKPRRASAGAAARAVTTLQRNFPRAFPRSPAPKVPLKVGILKDVLARAASLGLSERRLRRIASVNRADRQNPRQLHAVDLKRSRHIEHYEHLIAILHKSMCPFT